MPKIKNLNPSTIGRIGGSDLAIPFRMPDGRIGYLWGDTFDGTIPAVGSGPDWRSPVLTIANDTPVGMPIGFVSSPGNGKQLWSYPHNNAEFTTILPTDAISVGDRIYLWVMVANGLGNEIRCEMWYSDDLGQHWYIALGTHQLPDGSPRWSTGYSGGRRTMVTWERGGDGYIYIIGTGGLARDKNASMWRVAETTTAIEDPYSWDAWQYRDGSWRWGKGDADEILPAGTRLGEICLRRIQNHWVLSGFDAGAYQAFVRVGYGPIEYINWHTAPQTNPVRGAEQGSGTYDIQERLYGCYVHPSSKFENADGSTGTFAMIVSTWAVSGNPYRAMQYRIPTPAALGPVSTSGAATGKTVSPLAAAKSRTSAPATTTIRGGAHDDVRRVRPDGSRQH